MRKVHSLARLGFDGLGIAAAGLLVLVISLRDFSSASSGDIQHFFVAYAGPLLLLSLTGLILARIRARIHVLAWLLMFSAALPVYFSEWYLQKSFYNQSHKIALAASRYGIEVDTRSQKQVIDDLRAEGKNAVPFFRVLKNFDNIMPIATMPNRTTVYCNEVGRYRVYEADAHGFDNPQSIWTRPVKFAFVGDSFTQGACVPGRDNYLAKIQDSESGILNLGLGGNGVHDNVIIMNEYIRRVQPKHTLFVHYAGNDMSGMMQYRDHPMFQKYLDPAFTQNLFDRTDEIEAEMSAFLARNKDHVYRVTDGTWLEQMRWMEFLKLNFLRMALGMTRNLSDDVDYELFRKLMAVAKTHAESANSQFVFLYLPSLHQALSPSDGMRKRTLDVVSALGIRYFDLTDMIANDPDPYRLYAFGKQGGHFSGIGNEVMAKYLRERILPAIENE